MSEAIRRLLHGLDEGWSAVLWAIGIRRLTPAERQYIANVARKATS